MGFWNSNECFGFSKIEVGTLIQGFESNGFELKKEVGTLIQGL
jgi:hypothetical protein